jgi:hypothetical protein
MSEAERAEAAFWAAFLRNRNVDAGTAGDGAISVAGGYALCVVGTELAHTIGAGSTRALRPDDCEAVEGFYAERGLPARFELDETALHRDEALLRARGYADEPATFAILETEILSAPGAAECTAVRTTHDRRGWSDLLLRATGRDPHAEGIAKRTALLDAAAAQVLVIASAGGDDVGTGALGIAGDTGVLYAGAVLAPFRGAGLEGALVAARLRAAADRGAGRAILKTLPGSEEERAALQFGFHRVGLRRSVRRDAG